MNEVTAEQVKQAAIASGITSIPHHDCGICGVYVNYLVRTRDGELFFDSSCDCCESEPSPRSWQSAANWINMQDNYEQRVRIAKLFGLEAS